MAGLAVPGRTALPDANWRSIYERLGALLSTKGVCKRVVRAWPPRMTAPRRSASTGAMPWRVGSAPRWWTCMSVSPRNSHPECCRHSIRDSMPSRTTHSAPGDRSWLMRPLCPCSSACLLMAGCCEEVMERTIMHDWSVATTLATLCKYELAEREQRHLERHLKEAHLPTGKTLEAFDIQTINGAERNQFSSLPVTRAGSTRPVICCYSAQAAMAKAISLPRSATRSSSRACACATLQPRPWCRNSSPPSRPCRSQMPCRNCHISLRDMGLTNRLRIIAARVDSIPQLVKLRPQVVMKRRDALLVHARRISGGRHALPGIPDQSLGDLERCYLRGRAILLHSYPTHPAGRWPCLRSRTIKAPLTRLRMTSPLYSASVLWPPGSFGWLSPFASE